MVGIVKFISNNFQMSISFSSSIKRIQSQTPGNMKFRIFPFLGKTNKAFHAAVLIPSKAQIRAKTKCTDSQSQA